MAPALDEGRHSEFGVDLGSRAKTVVSIVGAGDIETVAAQGAFESADVHTDGVGQASLYGRLGDFADEVLRLELWVSGDERTARQP
jgi:hypothetical protein